MSEECEVNTKSEHTASVCISRMTEAGITEDVLKGIYSFDNGKGYTTEDVCNLLNFL
ncbi:MAG: hypothetical protein NC078_07870 [Ruminococcus sp.]|nr:hypothetical protein [Ruminococcus sp.]